MGLIVKGFCPSCRKWNNAPTKECNETFQINEIVFQTKVRSLVCPECGFEFETDELEKMNKQAINTAYRKADGILQTYEIKSIMMQNKWTTKEFSDKCGFPVDRVKKFLFDDVTPTKRDSNKMKEFR